MIREEEEGHISNPAAMHGRRFRRPAAIVVMAVVSAFPGMADGVPLISETVECTGAAPLTGATVSCSKTFEIPANESWQAAEIETHVSFHAMFAEGQVTMTWFNQHNVPVIVYTCDAKGLYVQQSPTGTAVGVGAGEASPHPSCRITERQNAREFFARGTQRLVVSARATTCWTNSPGQNASSCPFHGHLVMNEAGLPV